MKTRRLHPARFAELESRSGVTGSNYPPLSVVDTLPFQTLVDAATLREPEWILVAVPTLSGYPYPSKHLWDTPVTSEP